MMTPAAELTVRRFDGLEIQVRERRLLVRGEPVKLGARAFDLLVVLSERPGELVRKREILERVWANEVVEEGNIAVQISTLRKVLGGAAVATIAGRGYRFLVSRDANPALHSTPRQSVTHLPRSLPALHGREKDLTALASLVDQHRLVTVTGAGGIGKTLLAQHLLNARRDEYPHGVCWIDLGRILDADALPGYIATALGIPLIGGDPLVKLAEAISRLRLLIALDNAEHLLSEVARIAETTVTIAPEVRLLITSQAPLRAEAEHVYRLGPLAVPAATSCVDAMQYGSIALFCDRAQAFDSRFELTETNLASTISVCAALEGLPLAIELAAASASILGTDRLSSLMGDRLGLLTISRRRGAPLRQQTLRAAIEWSHSHLTDCEQTVFRRMAVIAGSASLELIQGIAAFPADGQAIDDSDVFKALATLVERSLADAIDTDASHPRYRLLDSPRSYATERLLASGEAESVRRRLAEALTPLFERAWVARFDGSIGIDDWKTRLEPDFENAFQAVSWAAEAGEPIATLTIGVTLLRALSRAARSRGAMVSAACRQVIDRSGPSELRLRAMLQLNHYWNGQREKVGFSASDDMLALARLVDSAEADRFVLYRTLLHVVRERAESMDLVGAQAALDEMLAIEDRGWPGQRLSARAEAEIAMAKARGDAEGRIEACRRYLQLAIASGSEDDVPWINLNNAQLDAEKYQDAAELSNRMIEALGRTRDDYALSHFLTNSTAALLMLGDSAGARRRARPGWALSLQFELQINWLDHLALLAALETRFDDAARLLGFADASVDAARQRRQPSEVAANARAAALVEAALGKVLAGRLRQGGRSLRDSDVGRLAFGAETDEKI